MLASVRLLMLLLFCTALFMPGSTHANPSAVELQSAVRKFLEREGYMGSFNHGQDLQRGISAYLWDNRNWLTTVDFHNSRKLDAVICLLDKKGYPGFAPHLSNDVSKNWCNKLVVQP